MAEFTGRDMRGSRFEHADLAGSRFQDVDLTGVRIRGALLVDLDSADAGAAPRARRR